MARYTGPTTKKARALGEAIFGPDRYFEKRKYRPGQHGNSRRRRRSGSSDYGPQLLEKQKAKFTYGVLERQFRNTFATASAARGVTGENLLQLLEARLDNVVYRLGFAPTRRAARQLVSHKHVMVNGTLAFAPSHKLKPGDVISVRPKSQGIDFINNSVRSTDVRSYPWLHREVSTMTGTFLAYPTRDQIPEKINEQLIVELYSK